MTVSLTPAEAESKISQIESARDQVNATLNKILDMQKDMLSSAWQGGSATRYNSTADQQHEAFTGISTDLNTVVETGAAHMRSIASMDDDD